MTRRNDKRDESFLSTWTPNEFHVMTALVSADLGRPLDETIVEPSDLLDRMRTGIDRAFAMMPPQLVLAEGVNWRTRQRRYRTAHWLHGRVPMNKIHVWPGTGTLPPDIGNGNVTDVTPLILEHIASRHPDVVGTKIERFLRFAARSPEAAVKLCVVRPVILQPAKVMYSDDELIRVHYPDPNMLILDDGGHRAVVAAFLGLKLLPAYFAYSFDRAMRSVPESRPTDRVSTAEPLLTRLGKVAPTDIGLR